MLFIARLFTGLLLLGVVASVIGNIFDASHSTDYRNILYSLPLSYFLWLVWQILKSVEMSRFKFFLAHLAPGFLIMFGLIPIFAPNKITEWIIGGVALISVGGMIIYQMRLQRKITVGMRGSRA